MENLTSIGQRIKRRYLAALLLLILCVISSVVFSIHIISVKQDYAAIINVSGSQRMLSQRIALYTNLYSAEVDPQLRARLRQELIASIDRFESNHKLLVTGGKDSYSKVVLPESVEQLYFAQDNVLDLRVKNYIASARQILTEGKPLIEELPIDEIDNLLYDLDRVVSGFENQARWQSRVDFIKQLSTFVATVIALCAIVFFLVSPLKNELTSLLRISAAERRRIKIRSQKEKQISFFRLYCFKNGGA